MKGITLRGMVAKLLSLSLLFYLAAEPAQAQSSRSSSTTNSAAGIRVTPTAVPSARAEAQDELPYYNSCVAPIFESMSGGVPYTGVCEREGVYKKYVCRHFARDFCKAILDNGSNQAMGSGCWVVQVSPVNPLLIEGEHSFKEILSDYKEAYQCLADKCGFQEWTKKQRRNPLRTFFGGRHSFSCPKHIDDCVQGMLNTGHAVNIFRSGGQEVLDSYGEVTFMLIEPQDRNGGSAVLCSWTQKKLEPVIPSKCKEEVAIASFPKQVRCVKYDLHVWSLDKFQDVVAKQDKVFGYETSKP